MCKTYHNNPRRCVYIYNYDAHSEKPIKYGFLTHHQRRLNTHKLAAKTNRPCRDKLSLVSDMGTHFDLNFIERAGTRME